MKFQPAGGSCFLYGDKKLVGEVKEILNGSLITGYFRFVEKAELKIMGADPSALLVLSAKPGYVFSGSAEGNLTGSIDGGHHGYDPNIPEMYTGFIAAGAGINKGKVIEELCVTDIVPLVAELLGIKFKCPDGKLIPGILK